MSGGLLALLDDVAAIVKATAASIDDMAVMAKTAAASLDDVAAQAAKAGSKAAGVVIDDAAVTPKYVVGLSPKRELPIIWNIAKGSLKNKIVFLLPAAMLLGAVAPWSVAPLLAAGGLYLCFEGYEKLHEIAHKILSKGDHHADEAEMEAISPEELEKIRTAGAIRTDFILSAEIMAIAYDTVKEQGLVTQFATLLFVAVAITVAVYGVVGMIVKADDVGAHLACDKYHKGVRAFGRGMIKGMPYLLKVLSGVGTAAMLWVGGGIIIHSVPFLHHGLEHLVHGWHLSGFSGWLAEASLSALFGIAMGFLAAFGYEKSRKIFKRKTGQAFSG